MSKRTEFNPFDKSHIHEKQQTFFTNVCRLQHQRGKFHLQNTQKTFKLACQMSKQGLTFLFYSFYFGMHWSRLHTLKSYKNYGDIYKFPFSEEKKRACQARQNPLMIKYEFILIRCHQQNLKCKNIKSVILDQYLLEYVCYLQQDKNHIDSAQISSEAGNLY